MQEDEVSGQLLTYMVMMNTKTLAMTKIGINQGTHFLKCFISLCSTVAAAFEGNGWAISTGSTTFLLFLELTLRYTSDGGGGGSPSIDKELCGTIWSNRKNQIVELFLRLILIEL